jgi:universal stress protein A
MEDVKRILVVSRDTRYDRKAVHYGFSLARQYGAKLYVMHAVNNPFSLQGWNLPIPSLVKEYKRLLRETRKELAGDPEKEILKTVKTENIDLIIMLAHEEGHLEHFLFGRSNEEIIRKMPCSVFLVKKEPGPAA